MGIKTIQGSVDFAKKIKMRRNELGLTIEEAAKRAGVGTKTWCRYEAGESIRKDKYKGVYRALNWNNTISVENDEQIDISEFRDSEAWSGYLEKLYGEIAAASFAIGIDILLDQVREDMEKLVKMPMNSHVGQIEFSGLADILPMQFCMRYDYDFLYILYVTVIKMRRQACRNVEMRAYSVLDELVFYLAVENSKCLMECCYSNLPEDWDEWVYDLFDDMDIITWLYSDEYLTEEHIYHFNHWNDKCFWTK